MHEFLLNREWKSLLIKSELYKQNGSQRVGIREFVKRGILKGTFFMDVGIGTDDYWGVIDAVFVENLVKLNPGS